MTMKLEKYFLLLALGVFAFALQSCDDDDNDGISVPAELSNALAKEHPNAQRIEWETKGAYYDALEEASKVAGFSRCHFSKLFRAYTGLSFTDFVTRERLHIAENLLKKPDLTITEVSLESGFNSISTFNRVFLKSKNVSPTDFRQMYLQSYQK